MNKLSQTDLLGLIDQTDRNLTWTYIVPACLKFAFPIRDQFRRRTKPAQVWKRIRELGVDAPVTESPFVRYLLYAGWNLSHLEQTTLVAEWKLFTIENPAQEVWGSGLLQVASIDFWNWADTQPTPIDPPPEGYWSILKCYVAHTHTLPPPGEDVKLVPTELFWWEIMGAEDDGSEFPDVDYDEQAIV